METHFYFSQLRNINEALNECVSGMAAVSGGSSTVSHTLQRHNDILQDYAQEFNRTKVPSCLVPLIMTYYTILFTIMLQANVLAQRQREELLGSAKRDRRDVYFVCSAILLAYLSAARLDQP